MEELYENIGKKIKALAYVSFIVETVGAIIGGLMMLDEAMEFGIPLMLAGPLLAFVSSWVLYGLGELIEKTSDNESHTQEILKLMKDQARGRQTASQNRGMNTPAAPQYVPPMKPVQSTKYCPNCGEPQSKGGSHCWACGQKIDP